MSEVQAAIKEATGLPAEVTRHGTRVRLSLPLPDVPPERWPGLLAVLGGDHVTGYGTTDPGDGGLPSVWAEVTDD
ncbi:hypothetical protein ACIA8O_03180 [Kitasatospora sp. NPDC051853]|uniref:hypothetical protein n=1 Tax=Kitasatospora sp. NPDC051853 TaxID=3364058 RepID=UPI0037A7BB3D